MANTDSTEIDDGQYKLEVFQFTSAVTGFAAAAWMACAVLYLEGVYDMAMAFAMISVVSTGLAAGDLLQYIKTPDGSGGRR